MIRTAICLIHVTRYAVTKAFRNPDGTETLHLRCGHQVTTHPALQTL